MEFHWLQWMQLLHWLQLHWLPCVQCTGCRTCTRVDYVAAAVILGAEVAVEWVRGKIIAVRFSKFWQGRLHRKLWIQGSIGCSGCSGGCNGGIGCSAGTFPNGMGLMEASQGEAVVARAGVSAEVVASPSGPQVVEVLCKWLCYILCYCCVQ